MDVVCLRIERNRKGEGFMQKITGAGAGRKPKRIFPTRQVPYYLDPFLMLDHLSMRPPDGFPDHPHRGFEIITYVLEGAVRHGDTAGNAGVIESGGLQKITAGRGIVHSEMPATEQDNSGLQLWINLPRAEKGVEPIYQEIKPDRVPRKAENGVSIRTLVGAGSPVTIRQPMRYLDVDMEGGTVYTGEIPKGYQGFVYVLAGEGTIGNAPLSVKEGDLVILENREQDETVPVQTRLGMRLVWVVGEPIGERPIYNGPFVD
jgi:redox-sensitive bicupin YhaK (pirin superfamily)